jgi:menaquinone-dependent protoporphyrinogen oxidase
LRVLVAYGSVHGATGELAEAIAEDLIARRFDTDVANAIAVTDLDGYDAAVIGGSLYWGRWQPDARALVLRCAEQLRAMPVWLFSSGPTDGSAAGGSLAPVPEVQRLGRSIDIAGHTTLGGLMRAGPGQLVRRFTPATRAGDFRDRDQVTEWVARIAKTLNDLSARDRAITPSRADTLSG